MGKQSFNILFTTFFLLCGSCKLQNHSTMEQKLQEYISNKEIELSPLFKERSLAYYIASISGKDDDYAKSSELELKIRNLLSNQAEFETLKAFKKSGEIKNHQLQRQLDMLYNIYLGNQADTSLLKEIVEVQNGIEKKFSTYRAEIAGKKLNDNLVDSILKESTKIEEVQAVWYASKQVGVLVSPDILVIVKLRNKLAQQLGFSNYHEMSLKLDDQDPQEIEKLFDELDTLTRDAFADLKGEIDSFLAKRFGISKEELMPWHYQNKFFQEAPKIYQTSLDGYYKDKDVVKLTSEYFNGIGLPIDNMLKNSDLYEKEGKYQHAYCMHIDRLGDVRVVCNVKNNEQWMSTMLHEYGHGVYDYNISQTTPYFLREPAHTFTTEAIAMMFGRLSTNAQWMLDMKLIPENEKNNIATDGFNSQRLTQLVFSRWSQVMYRFEKELYANPDQDLNTLWWDLVEKYQMLKRPPKRNSPDWAAKIHIATAPCYYHNYLLGELLASQFHHYIVKNILKSDDMLFQSYANNKEVGKYLLEKVFEPGRIDLWNDMIAKATGEKLTAKYYAKQFVNQ